MASPAFVGAGEVQHQANDEGDTKDDSINPCIGPWFMKARRHQENQSGALRTRGFEACPKSAL